MRYIILGFAALMAIAFIHATLTKPTQHKCNWEVCPYDSTFEQYSDQWCLQQIHKAQPELTYEDAEYILMMDCKDSDIN